MDLANGHVEGKVSDLDGKPPESTDYANYFCTYSFLYHQVPLLPAQSLLSRASIHLHIAYTWIASTAPCGLHWQVHRAALCC